MQYEQRQFQPHNCFLPSCLFQLELTRSFCGIKLPPKSWQFATTNVYFSITLLIQWVLAGTSVPCHSLYGTHSDRGFPLMLSFIITKTETRWTTSYDLSFYLYVIHKSLLTPVPISVEEQINPSQTSMSWGNTTSPLGREADMDEW